MLRIAGGLAILVVFELAMATFILAIVSQTLNHDTWRAYALDITGVSAFALAVSRAEDWYILFCTVTAGFGCAMYLVAAAPTGDPTDGRPFYLAGLAITEFAAACVVGRETLQHGIDVGVALMAVSNFMFIAKEFVEDDPDVKEWMTVMSICFATFGIMAWSLEHCPEARKSEPSMV